MGEVDIVIELISNLGPLWQTLAGSGVTLLAVYLTQRKVDQRQRQQQEEERREKLHEWVESKFIENGIEPLRDYLTSIYDYLVVTDLIHVLDPSSMLSEERLRESLSETRGDLNREELTKLVARVSENPKLKRHLGGPARDHVFEQIEVKDDTKLPRDALNNVVDALGHEPMRGVVLQLTLVFAAKQLLSPQEVEDHRVRVKVLLEVLRQLRRVLRTQKYSSKADIDRLRMNEDIKRLVDGFDMLCLNEPPETQFGDEESHVSEEGVDEPVSDTV